MRVAIVTPRANALPTATKYGGISTVSLSGADQNGFNTVGVSGLPDALVTALDNKGLGAFKVVSDMEVRAKVLALWNLYRSGLTSALIVERSEKAGIYGRSQVYAFLSIARRVCPSPIGNAKRSPSLSDRV